jgi:hypothetical protein
MITGVKPHFYQGPRRFGVVHAVGYADRRIGIKRISTL